MLIAITSKFGKHIINMDNVDYITFNGEKSNVLSVKFKDNNREDVFFEVENALLEFMPYVDNNKEYDN